MSCNIISVNLREISKMLKAIIMELKQNNVKVYGYVRLFIFVFTLGLGLLFSAIPKIESGSASSNVFADVNMIVTFVTIISSSGFAVLSTIMHANFISRKIDDKQWSYTEKNKKTLSITFISIFIFVITTMTLSTTICILLIGFIGRLTEIIKIPLLEIGMIIFRSFIFGLISYLIGLISFRIGFYKHSTIIAVISAIVLVAPLGSSVMILKDNLKSIVFPLLIILMFIGVIIFVEFIINAKKRGACENG